MLVVAAEKEVEAPVAAAEKGAEAPGAEAAMVVLAEEEEDEVVAGAWEGGTYEAWVWPLLPSPALASLHATLTTWLAVAPKVEAAAGWRAWAERGRECASDAARGARRWGAAALRLALGVEVEADAAAARRGAVDVGAPCALLGVGVLAPSDLRPALRAAMLPQASPPLATSRHLPPPTMLSP